MISHGIKAVMLFFLLALFVVPVSAGLTAATSSPQTIVKADTVTLSGTGAQNGTMVLWIIGRDYFDTKSAVPDKKGNYTFTVKPEESNKFSTGQYAFLIQDPGADKIPEITPLLWSDGIRVADRGKVLTNLGLKSDFRADIAPVVNILLNVSAQNDVDDLFTPYYFNVYDPTIRFNRVSGNRGGYRLPDQTTGESILITGTTNMGTENQLKVEIRNTSSNDLVTSRSIPVETGSNENKWSYLMDAPGLQPGTYNITVSGQKYTTRGAASAQITILEYRLANPTLNGTVYPEFPTESLGFSVFLPLVISFAALVIIGIIMLVSLRKP
ncbi:MAG: hypothetical protein LUQ31_03955 [Methanoregula sp.]|nr:hypothetical protein [Methanoregula sp.]